MKVKMILPALTEATSPFWRPIKYSLFPPLGLATLAGYLGDDDEVEIQDEHVERLNLSDTPDLVEHWITVLAERGAEEPVLPAGALGEMVPFERRRRRRRRRRNRRPMQ